MKTKTTFLREPRGAAYDQLLSFAANYCTTFLLVLRDSLEVSDAGRNLLHSLRPLEVGRERTNRWPGTELLDGEALVMKFLLSAEAVEALRRAAAGLFDWEQPARPEDLCFLGAEGGPWLVTIAHERDAYLMASPEVLAAMRREAPELRACLP